MSGQLDGSLNVSDLRMRVARSPLAPVAALPVRAAHVLRHDARVVSTSARWLARSREHTNFTYDLTQRNLAHLAWWVASVSGADVGDVRRFMEEFENDEVLRQHIENAVSTSARRGLADRRVRYGRRVGWYALVRLLRPDVIIETGTDKGLGSCVLAAALLANGSGSLQTIDINPDSGYLITGQYAAVTERAVGDSLRVLQQDDRPVDLFLHDSWHSFSHETSELASVAPRLTTHAVVLSDNAHATDALAQWAEEERRQFSFFGEQPADHWYPGGGIGASWRRANAAAARDTLAT
jgi:hypothetical protein